MSQYKDIGPLINNKLFDGVNASSMKFNLHQNNFLTFREGDVIFQANDNSENIFLIVDGEVKLKIPNALGSAIIYRKGKNDFFGEMELSEKTPRKSSAVANTDCVIYSLSRKELYEILSMNKTLKKNIYPDEIDEVNEPANYTEETLSFQNFESKESTDNQISDEHLEKESEFINEETDFTIENVTDDEIKTDELTDSLQEQENIINEENDILKDENSMDYSDKLEEEINFSFNFEESDLNDDLSSEEILPAVEETIENDYLADQKFDDLENSSQFEIKEEEIDYQKILEVVRKIYGHTDLEKAVHSITGALFELFDAQIVRIFLMNKDQNELWSFPFMENVNEIRYIKIGEGLLSNCATNGEIINLINPASNPTFNKQIDSIEYIDDEDILLFPIKNKNGEIVCIIQMINSGKGEFTKNDIMILSQIEEDISTSIENFRAINLESNRAAQEDTQQQIEEALPENSFTDQLINWNKATGFIIDDVKSLLSLIKRYSDFIKKKSEIKEVKEASDFIKEQANSAIRYSEIISDYINGKISLKKEILNLNSILDELLETLAEYVESKDVKLYKKYNADAFIKVDQFTFYFVCFQLTKNACEAMPAGGNLYIVTNKKNDSITIEFRDTGKGIDKEIQEKIFEPYFSFGKENKAGLGLAIASKIIDELDGKINIGQLSMEGASIIITLPIIKMD
ncbi:MAG: cyclic nucleotide-binding domain-containing protein [Bacteroidetes bacterium]|nr:cyclic nucleotide-binding domain-containing protein [Bacteroidota bacterium]